MAITFFVPFHFGKMMNDVTLAAEDEAFGLPYIEAFKAV